MKHSLYQDLKDRLQSGIPYDDAVQLFWCMFCTTSVLPKEMAHHAVSKEALIDAFERLDADGLILPKLGTWRTYWRKKRSVEWAELVREVLLERVAVDFEFVKRAREYLK